MTEQETEEDAIVEKFIATVINHIGKDALLHLRQLNAYSSIMKIILIFWTDDMRSIAENELQHLRHNPDSYLSPADIHDFTLLLWFDLNVKQYYEYVDRHKSYVLRCYELFNEIIITKVKPILIEENLILDAMELHLDPTPEQIEKHDDSKYEFTETVTYAQRWYPNSRLGKPDEQAWKTGVEHHYCHNEHHPQHWLSKPSPAMPWRYLVEAIFDMAAMELEKRFNGVVPLNNVAELLNFADTYLERFADTRQYELVKRLLSYTVKELKGSAEHK